MAIAKKAALRNEKKAKQEATDQANQVLIDAMALAEKYHVTFTELDKVDDIMAKIEKARKEGVVPDGSAPPEIKRVTSQSKGNRFEDQEITSLEELNEIQDSGKIAGFSGWFLEKENSEGNVEKIPSKNDRGEYTFIPGAKAIVRVALSVLLAFACLFGNKSFAASSTDEAVLGNDRWSVTKDGDLLPNANTYDIGSATKYPASIWVAGAEYTSFAAGTDGNFTDQGLTVTLDRAPTVFIFTISSGDIAATQFTSGTGGLVMENAAVLDNGVNGTVTLIEASDTLSFIFSGSTIQLDSSDGGFQFAMSSAGEGYVDFLTNNDTDDYLRISTVTNVPTIVTAGTSNLTIAPDGGTVAVTGILTVSGAETVTGILTASTTVTLQNSETIKNNTDGTVQVASSATGIILEAFATGTANEDATLLLRADGSTHNGDDWQIVSDGATNSLLFQNDTGGTMVTKFTIPTSGTITFADDIILENGEIIENDTTDDTVGIQSDDAALIVALKSPLTTTTTGTVALQLIADNQGDATDSWQFKNNADGTLTLANDSSAAGTYVGKYIFHSSGLITLINSETINNNTTDDTVTIASDDEAIIFAVAGYDAKAAAIKIKPDRGDDAADVFTISMDTADLCTITTGVTTAATVSTAGLWTFPVGITSSLATDASSLTVGSIITAGGIACAKQLYVGDDIDMTVNGTGVYDITLKDSVSDALSIVRGTTDMMVFDSSTPQITITPNVVVTGTLTFNTSLLAGGRFGASSTIASSSNGINPSTLPYSLLIKAIGNVAGETATLPNGTAGQILAIRIIGCGPSGTWIVTPTSSASVSTLTFNAVGDSATLMYDATIGWIVLSSESVTVALKGINTP